MWASAASIKSNITSLKKFYRYLLDCGVVEEEDYNLLCEIIYLNKDEWIDTLRRYDDPNEEDPFRNDIY